ncbi:MAG: hypothetical protein M5T52_08135 [Ignavibacteriaceae bacterium]|nr:hypothetical protein [Ignavibacteriaceae bacterium]
MIENDLMYKHLEEGTISFLTADSNVAFKTLSTPRQNGDAIE